MNYIVKHTDTKIKWKVIYGFDKRGLLINFSVENSDKMTDNELIWLLQHTPIHEYRVGKIVPDSKNKLKLIKAQSDLSFQNFWSVYNYKVGNKAKAEKLWSKMTDNERVACFEGITRYDYWLSTTTTAKVYPERFLSQKRWENEFN